MTKELIDDLDLATPEQQIVRAIIKEELSFTNRSSTEFINGLYKRLGNRVTSIDKVRKECCNRRERDTYSAIRFCVRLRIRIEYLCAVIDMIILVKNYDYYYKQRYWSSTDDQRAKFKHFRDVEAIGYPKKSNEWAGCGDIPDMMRLAANPHPWHLWEHLLFIPESPEFNPGYLTNWTTPSPTPLWVYAWMEFKTEKMIPIDWSDFK